MQKSSFQNIFAASSNFVVNSDDDFDDLISDGFPERCFSVMNGAAGDVNGKRGSKENLLPTHVSPAKRSPISDHDLRFKTYIVLSMTLIWTGYAITTRYTRFTKLGTDVSHLTCLAHSEHI